MRSYALCKEVRGYSALSEIVVNIALATDSTAFTCHHTHTGLYTEIWVLTPAFPRRSHAGTCCPVLPLCWGLSSSLMGNTSLR